MRNKHPGWCYRCGGYVDVGDGHFELHLGRWRVQHADCAIRWRGTDKRAGDGRDEPRKGWSPGAQMGR